VAPSPTKGRNLKSRRSSSRKNAGPRGEESPNLPPFPSKRPHPTTTIDEKRKKRGEKKVKIAKNSFFPRIGRESTKTRGRPVPEEDPE